MYLGLLSDVKYSVANVRTVGQWACVIGFLFFHGFIRQRRTCGGIYRMLGLWIEDFLDSCSRRDDGPECRDDGPECGKYVRR